MRKKFKKLLAGILLSVSLFLFASCSATLEPNSENPLQGQWKDTYGLTEYSFLDDQNLILTTYGFVDFPGTYVLNENGTIEIRYSVLGKEQINTYHFSFIDDKLNSPLWIKSKRGVFIFRHSFFFLSVTGKIRSAFQRMLPPGHRISPGAYDCTEAQKD